MNTQLFDRVTAIIGTSSAWSQGVIATAYDLLETAAENGIPQPTQADLLLGARDWNQWAWGGCGLCYSHAIAARYCSPSDLKRTRNGERKPNRREDWLDVEARAASQAAAAIQAAHQQEATP